MTNQFEKEEKLVCDRNAGHLHSADPSHHDVVQHVDEIGYAVLDHDRNGQSENVFVKGPVTEKLL